MHTYIYTCTYSFIQNIHYMYIIVNIHYMYIIVNIYFTYVIVNFSFKNYKRNLKS